MFDQIKKFLFGDTKQQGSQNQQRSQPQMVRPKEPTPIWITLLHTMFPTLCALAYVLVGVFLHIWHPTWLVFFLVPLYYSIFETVRSRSPFRFAYPVLAVGIYLLLGFVYKHMNDGSNDLFATGWVILLTIPLYYLICIAIRKRNIIWLFNCLVPIICIAAYLALGFFGGWWHPGWVVFFAIPLYYQTVRVVKKYKIQRAAYDRAVNNDPNYNNNDHVEVETMTREEYERRRRGE